MNDLSLARFKCCTKCGVTYPATFDFFYRHPRIKSGFHPRCKVCMRMYALSQRHKRPEQQARYYQKHKEKRSAKNRAWVAANRDRVREWRREYMERNRARLSEQSRAYYEANREAIREKERRWKHANPEAVAAKRHRRRALELQATGDCTGEEIMAMYDDQQGLCAYCEIPLFGTYHVEHMTALSRGGSGDWTNIAICCPPCNGRKGTRTVEEFMEVLRAS